MTRYSVSPSRPTSCSAQMCGCESCEIVFASRSKRWRDLRGSREVRRQDLDRHRALQPRVPRPIHLSHPARADRRDDLVRSESGAGGKRHLFASSASQLVTRVIAGETSSPIASATSRRFPS